MATHDPESTSTLIQVLREEATLARLDPDHIADDEVPNGADPQQWREFTERVTHRHDRLELLQELQHPN